MCAFCVSVSLCVCVCMRGDEKEENTQQWSCRKIIVKRRGEIIIRGSPNGIPLLKHTNDLVLTAGLQHLSAESHARRADASAAWAVCYCALCCPWAGQKEGGPFCYMLYGSRAQTVHVRQTQQSSYDQTLFESRAFAFCSVFAFVLCCFLLFYHYGEIELLDSRHSFIYLLAFQQPKWLIHGWVCLFLIIVDTVELPENRKRKSSNEKDARRWTISAGDSGKTIRRASGCEFHILPSNMSR